jgi:L-malate glycosyltransferase
MVKERPRIFLISNMYPSVHHPRYGIFVKNFEERLIQNDIIFPLKVVLQDTKKVGLIHKLAKYAIFYLKIVFNGLFRRNKFDLVYVHFPIYVAIPLFFISFYNKKIILNFHGSDLYPNTLIKKIFYPFQLFIAKKSIMIVVPSDYFKRQVVKYLKIVQHKIYTYPSGGINLTSFRKLPNGEALLIRDKLNFEPSEYIIGFTSNFIESKGWIVFLDAIKRLDNDLTERFKAIIIGDGPDRDKILERIKHLGLKNKVYLFDSMEQKELAQYFNIFNVFVFPTMRKEESLGLVGLEAMACGTPVIGSQIAGLKGYLEDEVNGYFFAPGNANDLFIKLKKFNDLNPDRKEKMINTAEKTAILYASDSVNKKLAKVLKLITNDSREE